jgi:hypothetical protein
MCVKSWHRTSLIAAVALCLFSAFAPKATLSRVWARVGLAANVARGRWRRSAPVAGAVLEIAPEYRGRALCGCHTWRTILDVDPGNQPVRAIEPESAPGNNYPKMSPATISRLLGS